MSYKRSREDLSPTELSPTIANPEKLLKIDLNNNMSLNSVADTISNAHTALHDQGGSSASAQPDVAQIALMIRGIDISVKSGFSKLEHRMDNIQQTLNTVIGDVHQFRGAVAIIEKDVNDVKSDKIKMEANLKEKIDSLEKAKLETELYSKKMNLLLFNIPAAMHFSL